MKMHLYPCETDHMPVKLSLLSIVPLFCDIVDSEIYILLTKHIKQKGCLFYKVQKNRSTPLKLESKENY